MNEKPNPGDFAKAMGVAMQWVSHITTCCAIMVLPGIGGLWLDRTLGTTGLFVLIGFAVGMPTSLWYLLKLLKAAEESEGKK